MTRLSSLLLPTERQPPADAEALSHQLMVRAGLVRQIGAGLWSWLPAGWRVHQKVVQVVREEMDAIGGQEMLMPVLLPAELWKRSGRYDTVGSELMRLKDRKDADMVLAMTHEEAVTFHVAQVVKSYRELPKILYHFQIKERDEPRPRAGVLRTREFIMKDAYTFDRDQAGLDEAYEKHRGAYARVYDRCGLEWFECQSDVGMMGGTMAHEYMAPCAAGEDDVVIAGSYSANLEIACADAVAVELPAPLAAPVRVDTPGARTIDAISALLGIPDGAQMKSFPVVVDDERFVLVLVRGDHQISETKLRNHLGAPWRPAGEEEIRKELGPPGSLGPVGTSVDVLLDTAIRDDDGASYTTGANEEGVHLQGVRPGRDFSFERADVREVVPGDTIDGVTVRIEPAIEIGNIFQLGTRYSEPLGATYLDQDGKQQPVVMGSYGIGPARIAAAAVEQFADEKGIPWPKAIAPWAVELVVLGKAGTPEREAGDRLYDELRAAGIDVLIDDRDGGPGAKFADAELLGCPLRLTLGRRSLESGVLEAQSRRGLVDHEAGIPIDGAAEAVQELWSTLP